MTTTAYNSLGRDEARECYEYWLAEQRERVALYYDLTPDNALSNDDEGCLVALCALHADEHHADIAHASDDASGMGCELCLEESQCLTPPR